MRWIYTGGTAIVLLCMALLGGCASNDKAIPDTTVLQIEQPSQSQEMEMTLPNNEDVTYEYMTEELYAERDGNNIYGVMYIPQNAGERMPAVIFSHGFGGNYQVGTQYHTIAYLFLHQLPHTFGKRTGVTNGSHVILFQHIFQRDSLHSLFRCFLNVQVKIPQHQLNIYTHATGRIGVDVLMEQGLVALYCPIGIQ